MFSKSEFRSLYERNAPDVYRFARSLGASTEEAEDITSETFARALASATPIRETTARAYLMTIARHYFIETRRRRRYETQLPPTLQAEQPATDDAAERQSELQAVQTRLAALSEIDRAALVMRSALEMSYDDIARQLGISVVAAKVKVHRARRMLAALIPRHS